jgi:histidinol-phosphate aminotransferase
MIEPIPQIAAVPASTPFVGPETLARRFGFETLVRLGANENPFGPSPRALEAMRAEAARAAYYGDPDSLLLREALAERHRCMPEHISIGAGIDDLQGLLVRSYLGEGKAALTFGTYPTFMYHVVGYGGHAVTVPYARDGSIRLDALAELAREHRPRLVYLANPDNPSGSFLSCAALEAFLDRLPEDVLLVLDEAYVDFLDETYFGDTVHPRIVRMRTFSKVYGLAGMRIGYVVAAPEIIATFQKIRLHFAVNRIAQAGALAALEDRSFVAYVKRETAVGREAYHALGRTLGCATLPSFTNFVCFDLGTRARAERMVEELLRRGMFVRKPGASPLDGHIRVSIGAAQERARFAQAFEEGLNALGATV